MLFAASSNGAEVFWLIVIGSAIVGSAIRIIMAITKHKEMSQLRRQAPEVWLRTQEMEHERQMKNAAWRREGQENVGNRVGRRCHAREIQSKSHRNKLGPGIDMRRMRPRPHVLRKAARRNRTISVILGGTYGHLASTPCSSQTCEVL